jgi:hypothetical protein
MPVPSPSAARKAASRAADNLGRPKAFPSAPGTRRPRPGDAHGNALLDYRAFELGEHSEHLEQSLPGPGSRCQRLPIEVQVNARTVKLPEEPNKVLQRAAQPVNRPCGNDIELAAGGR